jgi:hypothetical protein
MIPFVDNFETKLYPIITQSKIMVVIKLHSTQSQHVQDCALIHLFLDGYELSHFILRPKSS